MKRTIFPLTLILSLLVAGLAYAQEEEFPGDEAPPAEVAPEPAPAEPEAAPAEPAPMEAAATSTAGDMYVGLTIGPAIGVEKYDGTVFYFGPEFGMKYFQIPVLFGFKDSVKYIDLIPRFKYPMELIPNLILAPFGGIKAGFGLADGATLINVGIEIGARGTYMVTPNIGLFFEPVVLDFDFFHWIDIDGAGSDSSTDLAVMYRLHFGAQYHF